MMILNTNLSVGKFVAIGIKIWNNVPIDVLVQVTVSFVGD